MTLASQECVELAVSVALEGNSALLLVSNAPLFAKLLATALQRRRGDANVRLCSSILIIVASPSSPLMCTYLLL